MKTMICITMYHMCLNVLMYSVSIVLICVLLNNADFLVLENLTFRFTLPCIMDVKMGTRQYGDTDCLAKRQSKMVKVVTTTSGKLGVRIGGMQVSTFWLGKL